jgi:hypothetical protein
LVVGGRDSVWRRGPTAGSRTVALSTPIRVPVPTGLPGSPEPTPTMAGGRLVAQDGDIAEVEAPEELVARVAAIDVAKASGWCARGCRTRPSRASAPPRYGRCRPPPTPSSSWPSSWPAKGSNGSWSSPPPTTGGPGCTCWKPAAWWCGWSTPATPEHLPGRPKTDRLDAVWLARLNERGMLRPWFVPPAEIRQVRDYTRLRCDLTAERARQVQRLEQAAGGRPDQAWDGGDRHHGGLRAGHAGGADRRAA